MNSRQLLRAALLSVSLLATVACNGAGGTHPGPVTGTGDNSDGGSSDGGNTATPLPTDINDPNNATKDTDCDGLSDKVEFETLYNGRRTNPGLADTDGDGLPDGLEVGVSTPVPGTSCVLPQDAAPLQNTDPTLADTDGDGLSDGVEDANHNGKVDDNETHPLLVDTDCDGLRDGPSVPGGPKGEDQNANGKWDPSETNPLKFDTDGDGISDGVELGVTQNLDEANCKGIFVADADPSSVTDPRNPDSDGDGVSDGAEDTNQNGKLDSGELNPNDPKDATGPAAAVCTTSNLRPVSFQDEKGPDIKLALPPTFQEVTQIKVGDDVKGLLGYDSTTKIAFLAFRTPAPSGATDPLGDEEALRPTIESKGTLSNRTAQLFKTWEGFSAEQAFYDQTGSTTDLKRRTDELVDALVPGSTGRLSSSAAGVTGDFRLQALYVHRSDQSLVVVLSVAPLASVTDVNKSTPAAFSAKDLADGSALAQFSEPTASQCELFQVQTAKVDFLFVVDDSGSMATSQAALAATAQSATNALNATSLDWRMAMVTTSYHSTTSAPKTPTNGGRLRPFTRNVNKVTAWLTNGSTCGTGNVCSKVPTTPETAACVTDDSQGTNGGCWVGTSGSGNEGLLGAARKAVDDLTPGTAAGTESSTLMRQDASLVVVLLGDADDQTSGYTTVVANCGGTPDAPAAGKCEDVQDFVNFFGTGSELPKPTNKTGRTILVHGILCPSGQACGCTTSSPCLVTSSDREFNPQPISGVSQQRHAKVVTATGGVLGSIKDNDSIKAAMGVIIDTAIGNAGYKTLKPPIGASIKVAVQDALNGAVCTSKSDVPRSISNGFDFDGRARTLSLFGGCRPLTNTTQVAVSYQYWIDAVKDPNGAIPCKDDPNYTPSEPDHCIGLQLGCNDAGTQCVCKPNCGDSCGSGATCNMTSCTCEPILK